jgi:hypothetical protein
MAKKNYDGIIEAVHYAPDGQVAWVRAYLRRGPTWSDRIIMTRRDLIDEIKSGSDLMIGRRVELMAGTFDVTHPVKVANNSGRDVLISTKDGSDCDQLEGAPVI